MPLDLLKPLTTQELALLAANDHVPSEQVDWLQDRDTPRADVCLMFGQGFLCSKVVTKEQRRRLKHLPSELQREAARATWHLPQAAFAIWAECVYGAERRRAVESWSLRERPGHIWTLGEVVSESPKRVIFSHVGPFDDVAHRELRRRVLRPFRDVTREARCEISQCDFAARPPFSKEWLANYLRVSGFVSHAKIKWLEDRENGTWVYTQKLTAADFVPEPRRQPDPWEAWERQVRGLVPS
jgi:hypothetical protein